MASDPTYCEHDRTAATCEDCAHAAALADPRRAAATRDELHPFPEGGLVTAAFVSDEDDAAVGDQGSKSKSRSKSG